METDTQPPAQVSPNDYQWGHIHCAGGDPERGKNQFGPIAAGWTYEQVNDSVEVFNNGRHVDVVICDDPVSYDSQSGIVLAVIKQDLFSISGSMS